MANLMTLLADGLSAFYTDLNASGVENVVVVAMSEFGRNAFENASGGTDHGHGGLMFAMGSGIAGGQVLTDWPGLGKGALYEDQDLEITIDYRDVLAEILERRLDNPNIGSVFKDKTYRRQLLGVTV